MASHARPDVGAPDVLLEASGFERELFRDRYQRNNKRGGLKNLRCFPTCAETHKQKGFCGRPIRVTVRLCDDDDDDDDDDRLSLLESWAVFDLCSSPDPYEIGQIVSRSELEAKTRSKESPLLPLLRGVGSVNDNSSSSKHACRVFEFPNRGIHYGWASNKHTCNSMHTLQALVFEKVGVGSLKLKCILRSPSFMLFCRRRRRFTVEPTAPVSLPTSSSGGGGNSRVRPTTARTKSQVVRKTNDSARFVPKLEGFPSVRPSEPRPKRRRTLTAKAKLLARRYDQETTIDELEAPLMPNLNAACTADEHAAAAAADDDEFLVAHDDSPFLDEFSPEPVGMIVAVDQSSPQVDLHRVESMMRSIALALNGYRKAAESAPRSRASSFDYADLFRSTELGEFLDAEDAPSSSEPDFAKRRRMVYQDLVKYLIEESKFTRAIHDLRAANNVEGESGGFLQFLKVMQLNLNGFMERHKLTLEEFDRIFMLEDDESGECEEDALDQLPSIAEAKKRFPSAFTEADGLVKEQPMWADELVKFDVAVFRRGCSSSSSSDPSTDGTASGKAAVGFSGAFDAFMALTSSPAPTAGTNTPVISEQEPLPNLPNDVCGKWTRSEESRASLHQVRAKAGFPYILNKMCDYMEREFSIHSSSPRSLVFKFKRKLLSNGEMRLELDGQERPFGMQLPILSALSYSWSYRAWVDDDRVEFVLSMGTSTRLRRSYRVVDNNELRCTVTLSQRDRDSGSFEDSTVAEDLCVRAEE